MRRTIHFDCSSEIFYEVQPHVLSYKLYAIPSNPCYLSKLWMYQDDKMCLDTFMFVTSNMDIREYKIPNGYLSASVWHMNSVELGL
jgi:hypothetical protein